VPRGTGRLIATVARTPAATARVVAALVPMTRLVGREAHLTVPEFATALDGIFDALYAHPLTAQARRVTHYLRERNLLPNEGSTERLIRGLVDQAVARSPVPVPPAIVDEFWTFFHELMAEPELRGLAELGLDIARLLLRTYEPLLVEVINELKDMFYGNQRRTEALLQRVKLLRRDLQIIRRQLRALRYVRPFLQLDARDFRGQAQVIAKMVREFGPFFVKLAQVAAAGADFLPPEIAAELQVFQEDVPPMSADEARQAIVDSFGQPPEARYFGFDAARPLKSGSIGSVYLAKKPMLRGGVERLVPVVVKIGRHNLDREFVLGKASIALMLLTSQYWAPHGKLAPFLHALTAQVDAFIDGFRAELQFEREAMLQQRFSRRAQGSTLWQVPEVYAATARVIEMAYVDGAVNVLRAPARFGGDAVTRYRRRLAARFVHVVLCQALLHRELHGDLHAGNVLVDAGGRLHLIDWGNTVALEGRAAPVAHWLRGALAADAGTMADALVALCTTPESAAERRDEIREALQRTLDKRRLPALGRGFAWTLAREGPEGWRRRAQLLGQLVSNTQQLGLVLQPEYLHLWRSVGAMLGTLASLYQGVPPRQIAADLLLTTGLFPARVLRDAWRVGPHALREPIDAWRRAPEAADAPCRPEPPRAGLYAARPILSPLQRRPKRC
jgi:predicted unusual protein kinase regulating ubiquinone biosynthesis (AarF/ABC1/UbiB family)